MKPAEIEKLARYYITGTAKGTTNPRLQDILIRLMSDLFKAIDDLDISEDEIWAAIDFLEETGKNGELKLLVAGLGLDRFMDVHLEEVESRYGIAGGTPRTIEGPLYVYGAPVSKGYARLDDDTENGAMPFFMEGVVRHVNGEPIPGACVEVWHANSKGNYSHFDPEQSEYNLRRTIIADENGRYCFRSVMPGGYGVPSGGMTQRMLDMLGRHGQRPPHIHFFVHADGYRKLTTQINIEGSRYTFDDYAFADRIGLVPKLKKLTDNAKCSQFELDNGCCHIEFDFRLHPEVPGAPPSEVERRRAKDSLMK